MWFGASLLFKSRHLDQVSEHPPLWEESVVVLRADSEEDAGRLAEELGKSRELEYLSATGDTVRWSFEGVESIYEILDDSLNHGTEVFSRHLRSSEVESIRSPLDD